MQSFFQRAAVVIMLIASLLAPYGRCQSPGRTISHECCVQDAAPKTSVTANCCIVRSQLPAVVGERRALGPAVMPIAAECVPSREPAILFHANAAIPAAHHSPPPGASVLRI
jgi:hypothetical protein